MAPAADTERRIGPERGRLTVHTTREGLVARAGHDLTIELTGWSGRLRLGEGDVPRGLAVTVDLASMRIVAATGGVAPLTERDRREILRNAHRVLSVDRYPHAEFVADELGDDAIEGTLTLLGRARPLRLSHRVDGDRHRASGTVRLSDHGIAPFSAFFGTLRLADTVRVEAELTT